MTKVVKSRGSIRATKKSAHVPAHADFESIVGGNISGDVRSVVLRTLRDGIGIRTSEEVGPGRGVYRRKATLARGISTVVYVCRYVKLGHIDMISL